MTASVGSNTPTAPPPWIKVTPSAVKKIHSLIAEEDDPYVGLRIYITGGGCSGFQYGFDFVTQANDDDVSVDATSQDESACDQRLWQVTLFIDTMSFAYLKGSEVDYCEDVGGARFVIRNPHAKTTCGCGSSFSV